MAKATPSKVFDGATVAGCVAGPTLVQGGRLMRMLTCPCGKVFWKPEIQVRAARRPLHCGCRVAKKKG